MTGQGRVAADSGGEPDVIHADVVVVGGAMIGSSVAYWLTEHPDFDGSVVVVEPDWSYEFAQTTRAQNSIRQQFTNPLNIEMSRFGIEFIERFHERVHVEGVSPEINFTGTGYLFLADTDEQYERLRHEADVQLAHGADVAMLGAAEVGERFPYMDTTEFVGGRLGGPREGSFDGWGLFQGIRGRAMHRGARYLRDRVVDLRVRSGRVTDVHLESGARIAAGWVVNAAGCRARRVAGMAGLDLPVEPRARTSFVFGCREPIQQVVPLTVTPAGVHFRREQQHYMCGAVPDPDVAVADDDLDARRDEFEELIWPVLARYVPRFDQVHVLSSWGGQYDYNTLDHNLIIGAADGVENFLFANGFSGHGLQHGPAVGRGVSELIVDGRFTSIDLSPLGYRRIQTGTPILERAVI